MKINYNELENKKNRTNGEELIYLVLKHKKLEEEEIERKKRVEDLDKIIEKAIERAIEKIDFSILSKL